VIGKGNTITQPPVPFIAIPTTAGTGAEVTRNAVLGSPTHQVKVSLRSPLMLPRVAVVDPELTHGLPAALTACTGLDALTQLIEPFVSVKANPLTDALCREGMTRAARSLRRACETGDHAARADMCVASLFGGLALANAGLGAVHGFAGPLGGMLNAPHGALCAALLPAVLEMNARLAPNRERFDEVRRIVGDVDALVRALGVPPLRAYGLRREDFPVVAEKAAAASSMKANPVALTREQLLEILERAW
jgi:alcohol dehydrogenase class IV